MLDDLLELDKITRVEFQRPLTPEETRELFLYVADTTKYEIHQTREISEKMGNKMFPAKQGEPLTTRMTNVDIHGTILGKEDLNYQTFESNEYEGEDIRIGGFNFRLCPKEHVAELSPDDLDTIYTVKKTVDDYFKLNPERKK